MCTEIAQIRISEGKAPGKLKFQNNYKRKKIVRRKVCEEKEDKKEKSKQSEKKRKNTGDVRWPLTPEKTGKRLKKGKIASPKLLLCEKFKKLALKDTG